MAPSESGGNARETAYMRVAALFRAYDTLKGKVSENGINEQNSA
jgi:hypothetical protein